MFEDDGGLVLERDDFLHVGAGVIVVVAEEVRGRLGFDFGEGDDFLLLRGAGAGALLVHQLFETGGVHGQAAFARHQFGEVEREAVGVVKRERRKRPR